MSDGKVPRHPVDAIEWVAERWGIKLDPEWVAAMREYCDEEISVQETIDAATVLDTDD